MKISILPKFLFEAEDIIYLKDKGIKLQEGNQILGTYKVPCYKFYNLTELEVTDLLNPLHESTDDTRLKSYATRVMSVLFMRIRQVNAMTDKDAKIAANCSLLAAVNSLALIDITQADRFIPMIRGMI